VRREGKDGDGEKEKHDRCGNRLQPAGRGIVDMNYKRIGANMVFGNGITALRKLAMSSGSGCGMIS
jgi:hypothetical protein